MLHRVLNNQLVYSIIMKTMLNKQILLFVRGISLISILVYLESCSSSTRFSSIHPSDSHPKSGTFTKSTTLNQSNTSYFKGAASYYGDEFNGRPTSSGEIFDNWKLTAAHRTLPFGTLLRVQNLKNNKAVVVRVNDRGPFVEDRVIDLSKRAAEQLGMLNDGVANVVISIIN